MQHSGCAAQPHKRPRHGQGSGGRIHLDDAAIEPAEIPDSDWRRFHAERGERRADLAPMVRPVVQDLGKPDAYGGADLRPVITTPGDHGVGVEVLPKELRPSSTLPLHRGAEFR